MASAALGTAIAPRTASAQDELIEDPDEEARLRAWIDYRADDASSLHTMSWVSLGLSSAMLALGGVTIGLAAATDSSSRDLFYWTGGAALIAGTLALAGSITNLLGAGEAALLTLDLDEAESPEAAVVQMETLMHIRAQLSHSARVRTMVFGGAYLAIAAGSFVGIAASDMEGDPALFGYAVAGGVALGGALNLILSAFESDAERDWADYNAGLRPARPGDVDVALSPIIVEGGGGLQVMGSF